MTKLFRPLFIGLVLLLGITSLSAQEKLRGMAGNIEVLGYLMADEEYDSVILKANEYLLHGNVSYKDEGTIVSYIVEAGFHKGQYGDFSEDFEAFAKGFPESYRLPHLYYLETQSRFFRRHYYDAILAGDMGIRLAKANDRRVQNRILKEIASILEENILDHELYTLYDDVHKKVKVPIVQTMIDRGLDPPIDSSLLIPEYDDIWKDRATSHFFRGSMTAGTSFPFFGINEKYADAEVLSEYPRVKNGLAVDFTGTYRLLNGIGVGGGLSFAQWSADPTTTQPGGIDTGQIVEAVEFNNNTLYLSATGVLRFYLPKIRKKFQLYVEPGAGISYFAHWEEFKDADWLFTAKGDLGFTFNRSFEIKAMYKMVKGYGWENQAKDESIEEMYHWVGASVGLVLRRYSSKSRRRGGNIDQSERRPEEAAEEEVAEEEEVKEESDGIPIPTFEEKPVEEEPIEEEKPEPVEEDAGSSIFDNYR